MRQTEDAVTRICVRWMQGKGYRPIRLHSGLFYTAQGRRLQIGEPGIPDWIFVRPDACVYVEMKATGKQAEPHQAEYIAKLRHLGFKAVCVDSLAALREYLR